MSEQPVAERSYSSQKVSRIVLHHPMQRHKGRTENTKTTSCMDAPKCIASTRSNNGCRPLMHPELTRWKAQITENEEPHMESFATEGLMCLKHRTKKRNPTCDMRHRGQNVTVRAMETTKRRNAHKRKFTPLQGNLTNMSLEENFPVGLLSMLLYRKNTQSSVVTTYQRKIQQ